VRAVAITGGFRGSAREINASHSFPTMHDLLEANGGMDHFRPWSQTVAGAPEGPGKKAVRPFLSGSRTGRR
jgi:hypothetical protein